MSQVPGVSEWDEHESRPALWRSVIPSDRSNREFYLCLPEQLYR